MSPLDQCPYDEFLDGSENHDRDDRREIDSSDRRDEPPEEVQVREHEASESLADIVYKATRLSGKPGKQAPDNDQDLVEVD